MIRPRILSYVVLLPLLASDLAIAQTRDDGIPALLQFAEQYSKQRPAEKPSAAKSAEEVRQCPPPKRAVERQCPLPKTVEKIVEDRKAREALRSKQLELQTQRQTIKNLESQLTELKEQSANLSRAPEFDTDGIGRLWQGLRQALALTPHEQQALQQIKHAGEIKHQAQQKVDDLLKEGERQRHALAALDAQLKEAHRQLNALENQKLQREVQQEERVAKVQALETELADLRAHPTWSVPAEWLHTPPGSQAYAAGVALGKDILRMQAERKSWGIETDRQTMLAGIMDAFSGQYQLGAEVMDKALAESEKAVADARKNALQQRQQNDETYLRDFKQQKSVKLSPSGFWYRIDYAGDEPLAEGATVDIVVKESLTNGTVIQDMDQHGKVMSQPLEAYPPLFQEALRQLKNHGSLTMVVPPALAYGEKGYPPNIPPNATMIYQLRIADSTAQHN
ncbi:FKBP-type peptidyl-prolyl cis-trans isomerase N-terminal domain-containing protein [Serratia sp. NPDC078593]|uniref:FKBP-type peptidyl-prolyl cis-trans isomerase N-terminal domain-containing protein n=1 Tax=unclassified Serratia (in: enterobacteria) TaxID=2647522 RepID=UPI0037D158FA